MVNPKAKASRTENELANLLWDRGFAVVRGPSSGGGVRKRFQPDLVAIRNGRVLVIEVKARSSGSAIYLDSEQVLGISEFARRAGGLAVVAVRLRGGEWRFHAIESLEPVGATFKLADPASGMRLRDLEELLERRHQDLGAYLRGQGG